MALVSIASAHGAPGVTALAVALAHRLPLVTGRPAILVEADPDGGTVAARHSVGGPPALTALAGAARQGVEPETLLRHTVELASGTPVVTAHPAAEQSHAALRAGATHLAAGYAALADHDVVADLGRLRPGSPSRPFAAHARRLVIVTHPVLEQLVGERPYGPTEVRRVLGIETVSVIADDVRAVRSDPGACSRRRSAWRTTVDRLAVELAASFGDLEPADAPLDEQDTEAEASLRRAAALVGDAP